MKICFITYDINLVGGIERVISLLGRQFTESYGWEVDVLSLYSDQTQTFFPTSENVHVIHGHCGNDFKTARKFLTSFLHSQGSGYDFLFTFHLYLAGELARQIHCLPKTTHWIATEHNSISYYKLKRKLLNLVMYRPACRLVTLADNYAAFYRKYGLKNVTVIPNAVSIETDQSTDFSSKTILGIGRMVDIKRFDLLLEAFALIAKKHPDWKLRFLGEGETLPSLQTRAVELGISDQVEFPGFCKDVRAELLKASIFSMTTQNGAECFPMAALEAMECGVPLVSFDMYALREIAGDSACMAFAPFGDLEGLAAELDRVMSDPELLHRMGQAAKERAAWFHLDHIGSFWKELLEGIAGKETL